jgi:hypothetical protein
MVGGEDGLASGIAVIAGIAGIEVGLSFVVASFGVRRVGEEREDEKDGQYDARCEEPVHVLINWVLFHVPGPVAIKTNAQMNKHVCTIMYGFAI